MKNIFFSFALFSSLAQAHIDHGTWKGIINENAACFMDVGETTFINNVKNPLNERIKITIGNTEYSVRHPYTIDSQTGSISFNHDLFEDVVPTATGAYALQIKMAHTEEYEGPVSLVVMEHDWKTGFREVLSCHDLKLVYQD